MYLGVDLGTSSVKLLLADSKGNILDSASADYPLFFPRKRPIGTNGVRRAVRGWNCDNYAHSGSALVDARRNGNILPYTRTYAGHSAKTDAQVVLEGRNTTSADADERPCGICQNGA